MANRLTMDGEMQDTHKCKERKRSGDGSLIRLMHKKWEAAA